MRFLRAFDRLNEELWREEDVNGFMELIRLLERELRVVRRNAECLMRTSARA
ncbi:MAG: hypothetical protein IJM68_01105 [Synergistaceae bacterium]|nr:hypothetical protein [Synergistaceae bacterium]